jgi:ferric-dicitrate binding protein FerR (iron transport regulator)
VDASAISLWMDGFFYFEDQSVASILKVVKRWYDIEHIIIQDLPDQHFSGTFKRTKSLNQLLKNLQKLGSFNYQIKERRVTIMK